MKTFRHFVSFSAVCSFATIACAATIQWDGGGDGTNWNNALNWVGDAVPGVTNDVVIDVSGTNIIVNIASGNVTVRSLQCRKSLTLTGGTLTVTAGTSQVDGALTLASRTSLTARGSNTTFTALGLTALNGASLYAQDGGSLSLPGAGNYVDTSGCCGSLWEAQGAGSALRLFRLTNFNGNGVVGWDALVRARTGGRVELTNLTDVSAGAVSFYAENTNSVVDISALTRGTNAARLLLEARSDSAVLAPLLADGLRVGVTRRSRGQVPTAQFTRVQSATADGVAMDLSAVARLTVGGSITLLNGGTVDLSIVTNVDGVNFYSQGGTTLALPAVRSYADTAGCCGTTLEANGAGSRLIFPALTNLTGNPTWTMALRALATGRVELTALTDIPSGNTSVLADGANSVADLSALQRVSGGLLSLEARNAGSILVPLLTNGSLVGLTLRSGGTIPTTQFTALQSATADGSAVNLSNVTRLASHGSVTLLNGGTVNLNSVTNADGCSLHSQGGSTLSLPNVRAYSDTSGCCGSLWEASGAGSRLVLPGVTNLIGNPTWTMMARALAAGRVELTSLVEVSANIAVLADGTNSVADLSALQRVSGGSLSLEARNAGAILVPLLTDGSRVALTLSSGGRIPTAQFIALQSVTADGVAVSLDNVAQLSSRGSVTLLNGGSISFNSVTNVDGLSFSVPAGATLSLPGVRTYADTSGCCGALWEANGAGATLNFPGLTNLAGNPTWSMTIRALAGGNVNLSAVAQIPDSNTSLLADGSNSVVNFSGLPAYAGTGRNLALTVRNSGRILVPILTRLNRGQVTVESSGLLSLNQMTNVDGSSFFARVGQTISLSNVTTYVDTSGCCGATWEANGAGAMLNFSNLTSLTGNPTWSMEIHALAGGNVNLPALSQIPDSNLSILADATNSVVDLPNLPRFTGAGHTLALTVQNRGSIRVPSLTRLNRGSFTKQTGGLIGVTQLTNIDGSSFYVRAGEQISLNVTAFADTSGCCGATWEANGTNAVLRLAALTNLAGNPTWSMQIRALAGGLIDLGAVIQIPDSHLSFLADGTNSVVDLHQLAAFEPVSGSFAAEARLGGVILLDALTRLNRATLIFGNTGFFATAQLRALLNSAVTIDGRNALFTGLTDYRGTTFTYLNGGSVTFPPVVDLAVADIDAPAAATSGQPLQLVWAVTNRSASAVVLPRHDSVSLSTDAAVGNDQLLGEFLVPDGVAAGAVQLVTNTVIVPPGITGNRWFLVQADSRYEVFEGTNETNNILVDNQPVIVSAADLVVDQVTVPTNANFGGSVTVSWRVRNAGSSAAAVPWIDAMYLSTNAAVSPGAVTLGTFAAAMVPLASGATYTRTQTVALPLNANLNSGNWSIVVKADSANFQPEADENNNTRASAALAITRPPLPDLAVLNVSGPASATPGASIPVSWVVTNQGAVTVSNVWEETVLLATDAAPGGDQVLAYFNFTNTLPPGASLTRTQLVTIPINGLAGALRLGAEVDSANAIVESNETNNIALAAPVTQVPTTLTLSPVTAQISENASNPALQARVSRNGGLATALVVSLASSDSARLVAPATVTIPANVASASFDLNVVPDGIVDGRRVVTLTASAAEFVSASNVVTVLDADVPRLTLTLANGLLVEGQSTSATVTREITVAQPLVVTLANPSPGQVNTPATVTIPANAASVSFPVLAVDDYYVEPQHTYALAAAAPGHVGASAALSVVDNDLPQLALALTATRVSEGAGPGPVALVVTREFDGVAPLVAQITRSRPDQLVCAEEVTFAPGELTKSILLSPVDDALIESNVTVTLTVQALETLSLSPIPPGVSTNLILLDNDGPALQLDLARDWLCAPGASNAVLSSLAVQLRRTGNTTSAATATLNADAAGLVSFPGSVNFAANASTASFTVTATGFPSAARQIVTLRAVASGYTEAASSFILAADCAPDLVISNLTVGASGLTDTYFSVSYREQNIGAPFAIVANPPGITNIAQKIFLSADPFPGNDTFLGAVLFDGVVNPYTFLDRSATFRLPGVPGDYWVLVQADGSNSVAEVSEVNNFGVSPAPIHVDAAYTATVSADPHSALAGTPVVLSGVARKFGTALPAQFEIVSLHIGLRGTERVIAALTDANGNFGAIFTPLPGEAGTYTVGAAHPGVTNVPGQDTFTLLGMKATPAAIALRVPAFTSVTQQVVLENLGDAPLSGLSASVSGAPAEFSVNATVTPSLAPFGNGNLSLRLGVNADTNLSRLFTVRVTSSEGAVADVIVTLTAEALRPRLVITPDSLVGGAARGGQSFVEFSVANLGGAASGPLQVVLPALPFANVATPMPMPGLAPGTSNTVTLRLAPAPDATLGEFTGSLAVSGGGPSASVPFSFRVLSTNQGSLSVEVTDQFTYYAEGAPRVTNAVVELREPSTGVTLAIQTNNAAGLARFSNVTEGYYALHVTAADHLPYRKTLLVGAGTETRQEALLTREVVQFIWNVVPTEIGDRTHITIEAVFETVVPLPVVTVEPSVIDLANFPNGGTINLTITNHGLLAAQQTRISFSDFDCWKIMPLISDIGTLAARSAIVVPVKICRDLSCSRDFADCAAGGGGAGAGDAGERNATVASVLARIRPASGGGSGNCGGGALVYIVPCGAGAVGGSAPVGVANAGGDCEWHPVGGGGSGSGSLGGGGPSSGGTPCDPCTLKKLLKLLLCAIECVPIPDLPHEECFKAGIPCAECLLHPEFLPCAHCVIAGATCTIEEVPGLGCAIALVFCYLDWPECEAGGGSGEGGPGFRAAAAPHAPPAGTDLVAYERNRLRAALGAWEYFLGDITWFAAGNSPDFMPWIQAFLGRVADDSETGVELSAREVQELLALPRPSPITLEEANRFLNRWTRTMNYYRAGWFNEADVPVGNSTDFIARDRLASAQDAATAVIASYRAEGRVGLAEALITARQQTLTAITSGDHSGICAHVRLKIDQEAVIARDAFRATLEILNNSSSPLTNIAVDIVVYRPDGAMATTLFGLSPPALNGVTAVDGTGRVEAGASGMAAWNILPTIDAAPTGPQIYYVGGSIRYVQDGLVVTVPLALVSITVHPLAQLQLTYFHQRDVLGDDPFTDEIEPSVPYSLVVMVRNTGQGTARRLRITSAQPQIVENEKGLFIDFQIIATEVAGKNLVPSLTADFGDVAPGAITIGQWLFKSTLQGLFIDYQASFAHLDNLGDTRLSLIQSVDIRELIRIVRAPGAFEDGLPDMLVNDFPDIEDLPDTLYLSDGSVRPVSIVQTGAVSGALSPGNLQVTLTAPLPAGWSYLRIAEPGVGRYRLVRVLRSDGTALSVGTNVWTSDRTFVGGGHRPVLENKFHLLDYNSTGSYTLIYESLAPTDTTPPSSRVAALPVVSDEHVPVVWAGDDNVGGTGVAFYDLWVSRDGGTFLPWLQQSTLTGSFYDGLQGHTYAFYSVATDLAGNRESSPTTPDAITSVNLTNSPPSIASTQLVIHEGDTLRYTNVVADPNVPPQTLSFSLIGAVPPGATLSGQTGVLTWPTSESTGPSTNVFAVRVTDNGFPSFSATGTVTVIVNEVNRPPSLATITNRVVREGQLLAITNAASDPDLPANTLTFTLGPNTPAGAVVNPLTGVFMWRPTEFQGGLTNRLTVIVTDNGVPSLSATQQFSVFVRDTLGDFELGIGSTTVLAGDSNAVAISLKSGLELSRVDFVLEVPQAKLSNLVLRAPSSEITSLLLLPLSPDLAGISFDFDPAQTQTGLRTLSELGFTAVPGTNSAIVRLHVMELSGRTVSGLNLSNAAARDGRVFLVGRQPLLEAYRLTNGQIGLSLHGRPGTNYTVESTHDLSGSPWQPTWSGLQTNLVHVLDGIPATNRTQFWRAREQ